MAEQFEDGETFESIREKLNNTANEINSLPDVFLDRMQENILSDSNFKDGFYLNFSTEVASATISYTQNYIPVTPNTVYVSSNGISVQGVYYKLDKTAINNIYLTEGQTNAEFTTPSDCYFVRFNVQIASRSTAFITPKDKLGKVSISNLDTDELAMQELVNLVTGSTFKNGYYLNGGSEAVLASYSYTQNFLSIKPGTIYVFSTGGSVAGAAYDFDKNFISNISLTDFQVNAEYKTPDNCYFIRVNLNIQLQSQFYVIEKSKISKKIVRGVVLEPDVNPARTLISSKGLNTFIGAYNWTIGTLLTAKPKANIVIVLHNTKDAYNKPNLWNKVVQAQRAIANYWGCTVIPMCDNIVIINRGGINNFSSHMTDGIHPATDPIGGTVNKLSYIAYDKLKGIFDVWTGKKVVWYGTSIPAGYPHQNDQNNYSYANKAVIRLGGTIQNSCVPNGVIRKTRNDGSALVGDRATLSFTSLSSPINYKVSMLDLIGTANEPDLFVFDYGVNDYDEDATDLDLFDNLNQY